MHITRVYEFITMRRFSPKLLSFGMIQGNDFNFLPDAKLCTRMNKRLNPLKVKKTVP